MKNKKLVNLIIIALIIALIITAVIIKNTQANSSESNIAIEDEIVNEIKNTNEIENTSEIITEETNSILENVISESDKENTQEADIIEQEIIIPKEEPKQTNINTQEKKVDNSKKTEQPKTTQETISKQEPQVQEQKIQEQHKQETKTEPIKEPEKPKCNDSKHGVGVGNSNRWFNSYSEAISFYDNLINGYSNQIHNGEITQEEYNKLCPYGYETWSCPYCGKWTLNYYYR